MNFEYRMHDPRIGRFFAIDPLASHCPWNRPFSFSENKVIACLEAEISIYGAGIKRDEKGKIKEKHESQFKSESNKDVQLGNTLAAYAVHNKKALLKTLKEASAKEGGIGYISIFSHASNHSIILVNGRYKRSFTTLTKQASDVEVTNLDEILKKPEIDFCPDGLVVIRGCNGGLQKMKGKDVGNIASYKTQLYGIVTIGADGNTTPASGGRKADRNYYLYYKDENAILQTVNLGKQLSDEVIEKAQGIISENSKKNDDKRIEEEQKKESDDSK